MVANGKWQYLDSSKNPVNDAKHNEKFIWKLPDC